MKLQLAYDGIHLDEAVTCIEQIQEYIDIIEIGTPFVLSVGMEGVRTLRRLFPEKEILADMKIMDGGKKEAEMAFESGADYVTVLGVTDRSTIAACVQAAKKYEKKTVVDMICVPDFRKTVADMEALGVDYIAVHTGSDQQLLGRTPLEDLKEIQQYVKNCRIAVAGGINSSTVQEYLSYHPDILIVGKSITQAKNPKEEAERIKAAMERAFL